MSSEISKFIERLKLISFNNEFELDIKKDIDAFCLAVYEGESKINLLKSLRQIIDEKIQEIESQIDFWKKKVANEIDGLIEGEIFKIYPRKIKQFKDEDIKELGIKKIIFTIKTNNWEEAELIEQFLAEHKFSFQKKEEIDIKETKELLEKLGKAIEIKTLVIKTK
jgi:hypothetical protein